MSLSKYKESGLLSIPGIEQKREITCCLACVFKDIGVGDEIMNYIAGQPLFFYQVVNLQDAQLRRMINQLDPSIQRAMFFGLKNLWEAHGLYNASITHPGYYQPVSFDAQWTMNEDPVHVGQLHRGSILQVFEADGLSEFSFEILAKLKEDCMKVIKPLKQYQNLPIVIRDTCITIKVKDQEYQICRKQGNITVTETFDFHPRHDTFADLLEQYFRVLLLIPSIAMIVVDSCGVGGDDVPKMVEWLNFFTATYGYLQELVIVVIYSYSDFPRLGIKSKMEARTLINSDEDETYTNLISWLDVSSENDGIPEEQGNVKLEIIKLN